MRKKLVEKRQKISNKMIKGENLMLLVLVLLGFLYLIDIQLPKSYGQCAMEFDGIPDDF